MNYKKIGELCHSLKKSVKPDSDTTYNVFSLPAFDDKMRPEKLSGSEIKSNKFKVFEDTILFNKLNVKYRRIWNIHKLTTSNNISSTEFIPLVAENGVDQDYLYHCLRSDDVTFAMYAARKGTSNSQQRIDEGILFSYEIPVPSYEEQRKIASILNSIDERIKVNEEINDNLSQQIHSIYSAWFQTYSHFSNLDMCESELGPIPDGWKAVRLSEVTKNIRTRVGNRTCKVLSAINTGKLQPSEEYFTKQVFSKDISNYILVEQNDFAYNPARVNIGSIGINDLGITGCVSPVYVVFRVEPEYVNFFNLFIKSQSFKEEAKVRAIGSVRQAMNYSDFALIQIVYPPLYAVQEFNEIVNPLLDSIKHNEEENLKLSSIRDVLLPKLMSGELDISSLKL